MEQSDRENSYLSDELLIVRDSGEIPEVALHGSLFFLTCDQDGPGLELAEGEVRLLKKTAAARYRVIIRRDLDPANRGKGHYRGLARCIANWHRMTRFCRREDIAMESFREEVAVALIDFLERELSDAKGGEKTSSINCSWNELCRFSRELGIELDGLPAGLRKICPT